MVPKPRKDGSISPRCRRTLPNGLGNQIRGLIAASGNGFISTMSLWDPRLIAELAKTHQLIMFDNRGVGMSTDSAENKTTIPQMADDAAGLIQALGLKQPDVLGWSMGARITQQLVIRHPDVVGKVVIAAPNPGGSHSVPASKEFEDKLNDPNLPLEGKIGLAFPVDAGGVKLGEDWHAQFPDDAPRQELARPGHLDRHRIGEDQALNIGQPI